MKKLINEEHLPVLLKTISLYLFLNSLILIFFQSSPFNLDHQINSISSIYLGAIYFILSILLYFTSNENYLLDNWILFLFTFFTKLVSTFVLIGAFWTSNIAKIILYLYFSLDFLSVCILVATLNYIYESLFLYEESQFEAVDVLKMARTNRGEKVLELSFSEPVLLIFVRHFGCTFCRETVDDVSKMEAEISNNGITPIFVHMSDPSFGDDFFGNYFKKNISHISDPNRTIYKAFGLKRGTLSQVFGVKTFLRGIIAGLLNGHGLGKLEGDGLQLGGTFLIDKGQVTISHSNQYAAERFTLDRFITH